MFSVSKARYAFPMGPTACDGGWGGGGGGQQASCLVAKQAVEFPQVLASQYITHYKNSPNLLQLLHKQGFTLSEVGASPVDLESDFTPIMSIILSEEPVDCRSDAEKGMIAESASCELGGVADERGVSGGRGDMVLELVGEK